MQQFRRGGSVMPMTRLCAAALGAAQFSACRAGVSSAVL
ncbi:hypothetical protein CSUI_009616 [Cystoisospora suis]|uniref:Uncharacterized protein n=1 Tax=Cystoisospora suis TaxID=483139 RepID=A0A2C6KJM9_9APIC|nr:hypothetical protein CSUI_009616 [Cystoisospora suis]